MSTRRLPLISLYVFVCVLATTHVAMAQHEPASGGGTIGGGTTSRPSTKPATKPASRPATTPTRTSTTSRTTPRVNRPTTTPGHCHRTNLQPDTQASSVQRASMAPATPVVHRSILANAPCRNRGGLTVFRRWPAP